MQRGGITCCDGPGGLLDSAPGALAVKSTPLPPTPRAEEVWCPSSGRPAPPGASRTARLRLNARPPARAITDRAHARATAAVAAAAAAAPTSRPPTPTPAASRPSDVRDASTRGEGGPWHSGPARSLARSGGISDLRDSRLITSSPNFGNSRNETSTWSSAIRAVDEPRLPTAERGLSPTNVKHRTRARLTSRRHARRRRRPSPVGLPSATPGTSTRSAHTKT